MKTLEEQVKIVQRGFRKKRNWQIDSNDNLCHRK